MIVQYRLLNGLWWSFVNKGRFLTDQIHLRTVRAVESQARKALDALIVPEDIDNGWKIVEMEEDENMLPHTLGIASMGVNYYNIYPTTIFAHFKKLLIYVSSPV